ncbi:MAG: amidohydrolase family protein, partial [Bacteroidota bacterium]
LFVALPGERTDGHRFLAAAAAADAAALVVTAPPPEAELAALGDAAQGRQRVMMDANDDLAVLRAAKIGKEFSLNMLIRGSGYEYRRLDAIKATGVSLIVPLNFPDAPPVETPEEALNVSLEELRHWDAATENAARLAKAGISFALTTAQLRDAGTFLAQVRKAVQRGLSPDAALAALTTTPAKWMGMENQVGTLEPGKAANIVITDGDLFAENTKVREVWIDGKRYEVNVPPLQDVRGTWSLQLSHMADTPVLLTLKGEAEKPTGSVTWGEKEVSLGSVVYKSGRIAFTLATDSVALPGTATMSGTVGEKEIMGVGTGGDGVSFTWKGIRIGQAQAAPDSVSAKKAEAASFPDVFPPGEFGRLRPPEQPQTILIRNATIWTQGKQGKLENADLLVTRGKISQVGRNLSAPANAMVIDETGKHVTPGLIDCHSHTAVVGFGVNEGGQAITCETRIEDVLDPDDIWIYRQLAGGLTAANILHGSANPIGGQNAVVKWRWGVLPEELLIAGAQPGVKFALGENVKRSNFTPPPGTPARYPATRMGVEQIIRDRFKAARDYERAWKDWERDKASIPPRRDLELDAIVEMLNGRRLIHAHSYRQDEILMLIRLAEEFGIRIATFQHVLEGYKVADAIAKHGAGASSFSDWWAYKMEAWDAIPGNGPLMHEQGVLVSYNSDNNQLATRMNWEAAKALPFGIPETEALNFVTLNAAKQLRIDNRVGSLEQGKDADFVIWSGPPLSTSTKCEQTWVDGRKYFDLREDMLMRTQIERERATLVQKILAAKKAGGSTGGSGMRGPRRPNDQNINSCMEELIHELH